MVAVKGRFRIFIKSVFLWLVEWLAARSADKAHLEVERKFHLIDDEYRKLPDRLHLHGFNPAREVFMTDTFLPSASEGEMVRLRVEEHAGHTLTLLTLKSWVVTAGGGRERKEAERPIGGLMRFCLLRVGRWLSDVDLLSFSKHRKHFEGSLDGLESVVSLDRVVGLGVYSGFYLEVEIVVPVGADVTAARRQILAFAAVLLGEEREPEKRSYLNMLKLSMQAPISQ